jgi:hypothetical protein
MPTFDFSNIVRKIVQTAIASISNPLVIIAGLIVSIYSILSNFTNLDSVFSFPEIEPLESITDFSSPFMQCILYVIDFERIYHFYNIISTATIGFINFLIAFTISCIGAISTYLGYNSIRRALKDYA